MAARVRLTVAPSGEPPVVGLCAGKDCRKRCEFSKVSDALAAESTVVELKCIGLCDGPVVVIDPFADKPAVYSKLRSKKHRSLIVDVARGDARARKALAGRTVTKKKAINSVSRQMKRSVTVARRAA